jgi:competence protein ComEC
VAQRIGAVGHVLRSPHNRLLDPPAPLLPASWRGRLHAHLDARLQGSAQRPLLLALLVGDGAAIDRNQWATFRATGTVHLFVVSGLHIALTGGALLWLGRLWWRSPWCRSRRTAYALGAVPALLGATAYALLAGFGLPIQRALVMFAVAVWALVSWREWRAADALAVALWLVLLFDPLAVLSAGCWFSFIAVAAILLALSGGARQRWQWWRVQWAVFAASLPVLLIIAGEFTPLALPANLLAIPLTTLVTLPLAFFGLFIDPLWPALAALLWQGADLSLQWLCFYLEWLQQLGADIIWRPSRLDAGAIALAALAACWLLLPRGFPGRALAPLLLLPLLLPRPLALPPATARVTVIDVGQGLSVLVETHRHRLLYDTGPAFGSGSTAAELAIRPLLRQRGIAALDALVVSHRDNDHAGGWRELNPLRRGPLLVGESLDAADETRCRAGQHWRWDGIGFRVLHPALAGAEGNDSSCVLRIDADGAVVLLTGDIGQRVERQLLAADELVATALLVAPHHGSRSSSSAALVRATRPRYVVFSAGYRNHFRHPHPAVVARYRQQGATLFNTADSGAVTFTLRGGTVIDIAEQRASWPRYWQR